MTSANPHDHQATPSAPPGAPPQNSLGPSAASGWWPDARSRLGEAGRVLLASRARTGAAAAAEAGWMPDASGDYCGRCGATAAAAAVTIHGCPHCRELRVPWHNLWRLGAYRPPLAGWVVAMKFHQAWAWGEWLGAQLAERTPDYERALAVPVPLHWWRRCRRGYDQSMLIARSFARAKGVEFAPVLRRRRFTRAQSTLTAEQRRRNVRLAFGLPRIDLSGWTVWLIDDVKTSGSTLRACTHLLRRAGAERINIAVTAVADPKHNDFQHT